MSQRVSMLCSVAVVAVCFAAVVAAKKKTPEVISALAANNVNYRYVRPTILKNYKEQVNKKAPDVRIKLSDAEHAHSPSLGGSTRFSITIKDTQTAEPVEAATGAAVVEDNAGTLMVKSARTDGGTRQGEIDVILLKAEIERILLSIQQEE